MGHAGKKGEMKKIGGRAIQALGDQVLCVKEQKHWNGDARVTLEQRRIKRTWKAGCQKPSGKMKHRIREGGLSGYREGNKKERQNIRAWGKVGEGTGEERGTTEHE